MNQVSIQEAFDYLSERINKCVSEINRLSEIVNSAESVKISISDIKSKPKQERFYYEWIKKTNNGNDEYRIVDRKNKIKCDDIVFLGNAEIVCKALNEMEG